MKHRLVLIIYCAKESKYIYYSVLDDMLKYRNRKVGSS